jgi:hypothetical protein
MPISISDLLKIPVIVDFDLDENRRFIVYSSSETGISLICSAYET